ncbi:minor capsid protein [Terrisporobacter glycolicus]|uniref:Capsid protein n=1 Tax=Terrisporobacter glycolicus ATCC 14880 = DSM 1288 TaxID=1121315 RepID=A0ABZ2EWP6_9FIRM|nr:minor capsid protein [Terrisporobacter glycolicus]
MAKVKLKMEPLQKILTARRLQENGEGQKFLSSQVKKFCDPYVPFQEGPLKNTAVVNTKSVIYPSIYARYQYYGVSKLGKPLNYGHPPLRGKMWDKRMMADKGPELVSSVAKFCGGKSK